MSYSDEYQEMVDYNAGFGISEEDEEMQRYLDSCQKDLPIEEDDYDDRFPIEAGDNGEFFLLESDEFAYEDGNYSILISGEVNNKITYSELFFESKTDNLPNLTNYFLNTLPSIKPLLISIGIKENENNPITDGHMIGKTHFIIDEANAKILIDELDSILDLVYLKEDIIFFFNEFKKAFDIDPLIFCSFSALDLKIILNELFNLKEFIEDNFLFDGKENVPCTCEKDVLIYTEE